MNIDLSLHQPIAFVLRQLVLVLWILSFYGYGELLTPKNDRAKSFLSSLSKGMICSMIIMFLLGYCHLFNIQIAWLVVLGGCSVLFLNFKNYLSLLKEFIKRLYSLKLFILPTLPLLAIIFLRTNLPQHNVDNYKAYYNLAIQYFHNGGFVDLPFDQFSNYASFFYAEAIITQGLLLMDEILTNEIYFVITILILFQLNRLTQLLECQSSRWYIIYGLLSCDILFCNTIFQKNDLIMIFFFLELIWQILHKSWSQHMVYIGILAGVAFFSKLTFLFTAIIPFALIIKQYQSNSQKIGKLIIYISIGSFLTIALFLGRNLITGNEPFFPFSGIALSSDSGVKVESMDVNNMETGSFIAKLKVLFLGGTQRPHYLMGFFAYLCLIPIFIWPQKNKTFLILCFGSLISLIFFIIKDFYSDDIGRYSLPVWITFLLASGISLSIQSHKKVLILFSLIAFSSMIFLTYQHRLYLPGIKYHLGMQNWSDLMGKLDKYEAIYAKSNELEALTKSHRVAYFGESKFYMNPNHIHPFHKPRIFVEEGCKTTKQFLSVLQQYQFDHILIDETDLKLGPWQEHKWIRDAIQRGWLKLIKSSHKISYFSINLPK